MLLAFFWRIWVRLQERKEILSSGACTPEVLPEAGGGNERHPKWSVSPSSSVLEDCRRVHGASTESKCVLGENGTLAPSQKDDADPGQEAPLKKYRNLGKSWRSSDWMLFKLIVLNLLRRQLYRIIHQPFDWTWICTSWKGKWDSMPELSNVSAKLQDGPTFYSSWLTAPRCAGTSDVQCFPAVRVAVLWPRCVWWMCVMLQESLSFLLSVYWFFLFTGFPLCTQMCWSRVPLLPCESRSAHSCNNSRCSASPSTRSHLEKATF